MVTFFRVLGSHGRVFCIVHSFHRIAQYIVYTLDMEFRITVFNTEKITRFTRKKINSAEYQECIHGQFLDGF